MLCASNGPLALSTAGGDNSSTLVVGCLVIFKSYSGHMAMVELIVDLTRYLTVKVIAFINPL